MAPVPKKPPDKVNVLEPEQIELGDAEALAAAVELEFTVIVMLFMAVVPQASEVVTV